MAEKSLAHTAYPHPHERHGDLEHVGSIFRPRALAAALERGATREARGLKIALTRSEEVEHLGRGRFRVPGCAGGSYLVDLAVFGGEPSCSCPDFERRGEPCKHVYASIVVRAKRHAASRRRHRPRTVS